ncbi:hypothetical protein ACFL3B_06385, partial [Gemmatimonadota bacterium]
MPRHHVSRRTFLGEALCMCGVGPALLHGKHEATPATQDFSPIRSPLPNPYMEDGKPVVVMVRGTEFPAMFDKGMEILGGFTPFGTDKSVVVKP